MRLRKNRKLSLNYYKASVVLSLWDNSFPEVSIRLLHPPSASRDVKHSLAFEESSRKIVSHFCKNYLDTKSYEIRDKVADYFAAIYDDLSLPLRENIVVGRVSDFESLVAPFPERLKHFFLPHGEMLLQINADSVVVRTPEYHQAVDLSLTYSLLCDLSERSQEDSLMSTEAEQSVSRIGILQSFALLECCYGAFAYDLEIKKKLNAKISREPLEKRITYCLSQVNQDFERSKLKSDMSRFFSAYKPLRDSLTHVTPRKEKDERGYLKYDAYMNVTHLATKTIISEAADLAGDLFASYYQYEGQSPWLFSLRRIATGQERHELELVFRQNGPDRK